MDKIDETLFTRRPYTYQPSQRVIEWWHKIRSTLYLCIQLPTVNYLLTCFPKRYTFLFLVIFLYALILMMLMIYLFRTESHLSGKNVHLGNVIFRHPKSGEAFHSSMVTQLWLSIILLSLYYIKNHLY